jgi:uncharacterized iron-regulated protein
MTRALLPVLLLAACGPSVGPPPDPPPIPRDAPPVLFEWKTSGERDNPLVGRIWSVGEKRFVAREEIETALASAKVVLLGDARDNPDHHRLEAAMIEAMADRGRHPAVAMEMLDPGDQAKLDATHPADVDAFFRAVDWEHKGGPPAEAYAPIVRVALAKRLPLVSADHVAQATDVVLVAGADRAQKDRGAASAASVAFVEVEHGQADPAKYGAAGKAGLSFDYVWFTPRWK